MDSIGTNLIRGFLLLNSVHWGGVILTALLNNVVGIFIDYTSIPWFRLVIVFAEILLAFSLLRKAVFKENIIPNSLLKLTVMSVFLFICAQFAFVFDVNGMFCGLSLLDGSATPYIDSFNNNLRTVRIIESLMISIAIAFYVWRHLKTENEFVTEQ